MGATCHSTRTDLSGRVLPVRVRPFQGALAILGIAFVASGIYVASAVDPLTGLAVLVVGAFLLVLPITAIRED